MFYDGVRTQAPQEPCSPWPLSSAGQLCPYVQDAAQRYALESLHPGRLRGKPAHIVCIYIKTRVLNMFLQENPPGCHWCGGQRLAPAGTPHSKTHECFAVSSALRRHRRHDHHGPCKAPGGCGLTSMMPRTGMALKVFMPGGCAAGLRP